MANSKKAKNKPNKLSRISKIKVSRLVAFALFVIIFASVGAYLYMNSRASGAAIMSVLPANQSTQIGSVVTVTIQEDSLTDLVNAIQADLAYDQTKLQFVSIDLTGGAFSMEARKTGGNGVINLALATATPVSGSKTVATVTFNAIANGVAAFSLANTSAIVRTSDSINILGTMNGASLTVGTVADSTVPSVPTGLALVSSTRSSIAFRWAASTDNVAVTGYKIYRDGNLVGTSTTNSYTDTGLKFKSTYRYTVAAYDGAGNISTQSAASSYKAVGKR